MTVATPLRSPECRDGQCIPGPPRTCEICIIAGDAGGGGIGVCGPDSECHFCTSDPADPLCAACPCGPHAEVCSSCPTDSGEDGQCDGDGVCRTCEDFRVDACPAECNCGNGAIDSGEACDPGDGPVPPSDDACRARCQSDCTCGPLLPGSCTGVCGSVGQGG